MRRRLVLLSLATTTLVVISLLVPLGLLVRRQASDRARVEAERHAQATAGLIALAVTLGADSTAVEAAVGPLRPGVIVVLPEGTTVGQPLPGQGSLVESAMLDQATVTRLVDEGWEVALPVIGREGVAVVDVFVTNDELTMGVAEAWLLLGLLGVVLIAAATWVADRLGRRLVYPIRDLADAAHRLGEGDLDARVAVGEPEEIQEVGEAFNLLATRLEKLLEQEREAVADLSHRLRTPIASLRLQAEQVADPDDRLEVLAQVDRLESSIDNLIVATRAGAGAGSGRCSLDEVVAHRAAFWRVLADEQGRTMTLATAAQDVELGMSSAVLEAAVDALIGNVFSHTPPGTSFSVSTGESGHRPWLEVADEGPGFQGEGLIDRGESGRGSTGLGLDIVRRTAEMTGGDLRIDESPRGGAAIRVRFG